MNKNEMLKSHRSHAWQPFTQMKLAPDPVFISRAEGAHLFDCDGNKIIDAIGSWWVNIHGHNHPHINAAIVRQLHKFEHVMYAGFSHKEVVRLSGRLAVSTENRLPRVFYSDNGSTAVEIALKMAFQFFANCGRSEKKEFVSLQNGYHGDTIGTMSVGARSVFHRMYEPVLFSAHQATAPDCPFELFGNENKSLEALSGPLASLESLFEKRAEKICGFIVEPLLQGAGGMRMHPPVFLKKIRELCDRYEIFLIFDEVFTGCGRTGKMYAAQTAGVWPDIMALSKGLSGGYLPFAATLASEKIYQGFYSDDRTHTLFHGHSMTANPLGCAAANASLDLLEREDSLNRVMRLEQLHKEALQRLVNGPLKKVIKEIRFLGSVGVVEFDLEGDYTSEFAWKFHAKCIERGALLRPLGNVVYLAPPFVILEDDLRFIYETLEAVSSELLLSH